MPITPELVGNIGRNLRAVKLSAASALEEKRQGKEDLWSRGKWERLPLERLPPHLLELVAGGEVLPVPRTVAEWLAGEPVVVDRDEGTSSRFVRCIVEGTEHLNEVPQFDDRGEYRDWAPAVLVLECKMEERLTGTGNLIRRFPPYCDLEVYSVQAAEDVPILPPIPGISERERQPLPRCPLGWKSLVGERGEEFILEL